MLNLKSIKRKISSVKNTRQITKAMKMVAGAKLKRAQAAMNGFKPYADTYKAILSNIVNNTLLFKHPFFRKSDAPQNIGYIIISTDKGLCGSFNVNVFKRAAEEISGKNANNPEQVKLYILGKKGSDFFKRRPYEIMYGVNFAAKNAGAELAAAVSDGFISGKIDELYIISNLYISTLVQKADSKRLLPLVNVKQPGFIGGYLIEPIAYEDEVLDKIFERYITVEIHARILESRACEEASRMNAMDNATRNAGKLIDKLTLSYNKARQAAVTLELLDIINGVNSLK